MVQYVFRQTKYDSALTAASFKNSNIPCDGHPIIRLNEKTFCQCHVFFKLDLFELLISAAFVIEEWSPLTSTNS